jgi:hypothetical protein
LKREMKIQNSFGERLGMDFSRALGAFRLNPGFYLNAARHVFIVVAASNEVPKPCA